jgi:TRAP-type C4-dicarboxylate transport system permease small subunit
MEFRAIRPLLSQKRRQLKWRWLDPLEYLLLALCGAMLAGFTAAELADVLFRLLLRPWLSAQEWSIAFFVWGVFIGSALAVRRNDHVRISAIAESFAGSRRTLIEVFQQLFMLAVSGVMIYYGYLNYRNGFGGFLMPSLTPIAVLYAAIPVSGLLTALFTVEQLVNGLVRGFEDPPHAAQSARL